MTTLEDFNKISNVDGVDQYILIDNKQNIITHDIENPDKVASIITTCGKNSYAIAKTQLKYLIFSRSCKNNIFIFPVGNYYLGVVKSKNIENITLANNIDNFLKALRRILGQHRQLS
jgi:hypothetical protein